MSKYLSRIAVTKIRAVLIIALVLGSGVGGSLFWWYMQPKAFTTLSGLVHLDVPLIDATVSIYDLDGVKVFEQQDATHTTGSFIVNVSWGSGSWGGDIPNDFTIVATGGTVENEPFTGTIVRTVHNYSEGQYYHLNAITTLITAYLQKHPEMTYGEAEEAVKNFLGVPEYLDMELVVDSSAYYSNLFDHTYFMLQAEEHADFDTFIGTLLDDFEMGQRRIFSAVGDGGSSLGKLLGSLGNDIFSGVMGWGVFKGMDAGLGFIMRQLGYKDTDMILAEISAKLDEVLTAVHNIETEIQAIEKELIVIEEAIDHLEELEIEKTLLEYIETIDTTFDVFRHFSDQETVDDEDLERLRNSILDPNAGVIKAMNVIHDLIQGYTPAYNKAGMLEMLTHNIAIHTPSYEAELLNNQTLYQGALQNGFDSYVVQDQFYKLYNRFLKYYQTLENYFTGYFLIQVRGLILIAEAYNYHNQTALGRDYLINTFLPKIKAQAETFMKCVDSLVFNVHPTPMAEFPNMGTSSSWDEYPASPDRKVLVQIYRQADYLVDKCVKPFSGEASGGFKARVLLSMLQPTIERTWDQYWNTRTTTTSTVGGEPTLQFSPAPIELNDYRETLVFQFCGYPRFDQEELLDPSTWPIYEPLSSELRNVTIYANAPSRWGLPRSVTDYGTDYGTDKYAASGQMDHTVPYGQESTIHYVVFDFGRLPSGYYRLNTWQAAEQVNEGTGWVLDSPRKHSYYIQERTDEKGQREYYSRSWEEAGDAVVYIGFQQGPSSDKFTTINPWRYHLYDGYAFSRQGFIQVRDDEDGDPFGYWGGYWRQSDGRGSYRRNPTADAWLDELYPNRNHGAADFLNVQSFKHNRRTILKFDLTGLPPNIFVESATLSLYYNGWQSPFEGVHDPAGRTYYCYRLTETNWVEGTKMGAVETGSCCWSSPRYDPHYAGGLGWGTPMTTGGAYTTMDGASAVVPKAPSGSEWDPIRMSWNVLGQAQYAIANTGKVAHFIILDGDEYASTKYRGYFVTEGLDVWIIKGYTELPVLEVTYRVID